MGWIEWGSTTALGTNGVMPTGDGGPFHIGAYAATTNGGVWLNPLKLQGGTPSGTQTWPDSGLLRATTYTDPNVWIPGSIGTAKFFPGMAGDAKEIQVIDVDQ